MARIPIQNETDYTLTDDMMQQIIRDAQEHFGEEVRAIRVQSGIERHALNARTWEVRYAFSPQDFGLGYPMPTVTGLTQMLGLRKTWEDKERHMMGFTFAKSDAEIVIHANPSLPKFDYSFLVDDVEGFCTEYRTKGYRVALEPMDVRCGKYAVVSDPDGNAIPIIDLSHFGGKPR